MVIHRAIFGSFERFLALLIEHYAGAWPLWLSPRSRCAILPIADRHLDYAGEVRDQLAAAGLRVELDERVEKIGYKIREAQLQKIPYMLVIGDREAAEAAVAVRSRTAGDLGGQQRGRRSWRRRQRKLPGNQPVRWRRPWNRRPAWSSPVMLALLRIASGAEDS